MPQDLPTAAELVEAVREYLESDALPALDGRTQFHMRVAIKALDIVRRELDLAAAADQAELAGLYALLGEKDCEITTGDTNHAESVKTTLDRMNAELSRSVRSGGFNTGSSRTALFEHLDRTLRDKLAIANPTYID